MRKGCYDVKISSDIPIQPDLELDIDLDYAFMLDLDKSPEI